MDNNRIKFRAVIDGKIGEPFNPFDPVFMASGGTFPEGTIFEQFTGLTDKEGKEIYEGDLLTRDLGVKWKVEFTERGWRAVSFPNHTGLYLDPEQFVECKIVGTIHQ